MSRITRGSARRGNERAFGAQGVRKVLRQHHAHARRTRRARAVVRANAAAGFFDDPTFALDVLTRFGTANDEHASTEEARVLWEHDFLALDVRATSETEFEGKIPNPPRPGRSSGDRVICVPLVHATRRYDAALGRKVYAQEPVDAEAFAREVTTSAGGAEGLLVMDHVGGARAERAKEILNAHGFERVVVVRGGANAWKSAWDSNMRRRQLPGAFSRGFDSAMFAESNVVAEQFGASADDTVWVV